MPTVTLTPIACTESAGWKTLYYCNTTNSSYFPRRINFSYAANGELGAAGVNITGVAIHGYARNSATTAKPLRMGFKPAATSSQNTWSTCDGISVLGGRFTAVGASNGSSNIYNQFTQTYDGNHVFAKHIRAAFQNGNPIYLGVIQPDNGKSISVNTTLSYWTIDVTYELLGNIPTTNVATATLGSTAITTTVNRIIDGSATALRYKIGNTVVSTVSLGTGTSHTYTPPAGLGAYFPGAMTAVLTVEAVTTVDSVEYGTIAASVTLTLPEDARPTCTAALTRIWAGGVPSASQIAAYVQTKSGVQFALSGTGRYGASIVGYSLTIEGRTYEGSSVTHPAFSGSGTIAYVYTVTDSRGLWRRYNGTISVLPWQPPRIQSFSVVRVTDTGAEAIDGTYAKGGVAASVSSLTVEGTERNGLRFQIAYREIAADGAAANAWVSSDTVTGSSISGTFGGILTSGGSYIGGGGTDSLGNNLPFNDMAGYEFQLTVYDLFGESTAFDRMPTKEVAWDVDEATGKMGFGGDAPTESEDAAYRFHGVVDFAAGAKGCTIYSTGEIDTGNKWMDGKPIYSKTWDLTGSWPSGTDPNFLLSIEEFDLPVEMTGVVRVNSRWANVNFAFSTSVLVSIYVIDGRIYLTNTSNYAIDRIIIHLRYTKSTDAATRYVLPCLTANSSQGCVASASTVINTNFPAWQAFNANADTHWASSASDTNRWIQIQMPHKLKNMQVVLTNDSYATDGVISGNFIGSNNGSNWVQIGSFSGRPSTPFQATRHDLHNAAGYSYLRIAVTEQASATNASGFSDIRIEGEIASS